MNTKNDSIGLHTSGKPCFSYIRFSSRKQSRGDSERRQSEIAPRVAKEKGWELRPDLNAQDLGLSAYHKANLGPKGSIAPILEGVKSGKIPQGAVMILEAWDRLTRTDIHEAMPLLWELLTTGLEIYIERTSRHLTKQSLKDAAELTLALFEMKGAFEYSDKLSMRVRKAWENKKARATDGVILTTMNPAWLIADRKANKFTEDEAKVATINRIFTSYANGKGVRTIMRELNAENVPTFGKGNQNRAGGWSSTHLRRLLTFRGVLGEYQPCRYIGRKREPVGQPVANYYPEVIKPALFYRVQEMLTKTAEGLKGRHASGPKANVTNLFTGLVKCAVCGGSMVIKQSGLQRGYSYTSLVCYNASRGQGCKYATLQYQYVERAILTVLFSTVVPALANADSREDELVTLKGELKETKKQQATWVAIIEESPTPPKIAAQKLNALETKEAVLQRKIESLSATINEHPLADWQHVPKTPENRLRIQSILANEIESLTVNAGERKAMLTLKSRHVFRIAWAVSKGSNATRLNPADYLFVCEGHKNPYIYLDDVLVWKTDKSMSWDEFQTKMEVRETGTVEVEA